MERVSRRTRSQAAPDWTAQESLTLVNEVKALEVECGGTLSSFQKWQLIAAHCNALDVNRNMNQCRRKWDSLVEDYRRVKTRESVLFDGYGRTDSALPGGFSLELFEAIDAYVKMQEKETNSVDTDPDSDPEAQADEFIFLESGSKKNHQRGNNKKHMVAEETGLHSSWRHGSGGSMKLHIEPDTGFDKKFELSKIHQKTNYEPSVFHHKVKSPERSDEHMEAAEQQLHKDIGLDEKLQLPKIQQETNCEPSLLHQKVKSPENSKGEKEMAALITLHNNAQLINAIVEGDVKFATASTDLVRLQADQLIDCLGVISKTLGQLCEVVQECE